MNTRTEDSAGHLFRFRRFSMSDAHCPMKIGTDGVLLGAWADAGDAIRDTLCLCDAKGGRSEAYLELTKDFHLFTPRLRPKER